MRPVNWRPVGLETLCGVAPEACLEVVVLEVRRDASGAEVTPFTDNGIAEEAVVGLVAESGEHRVVDLAADLAVGAYGRAAVDLRAHVELGMVAQGERAADIDAFHHRGVAADIDRAAEGVYRGAEQCGALFDKEARGVADEAACRVERLRRASGRQQLEIGGDGGVVAREDVGQTVDGDEFPIIFAGGSLGAVAGYEAVALTQRLAGSERTDGVGKSGVRHDIARYPQAARGVGSGVENRLESSVGCGHAIVARKATLPFFFDCQYALTQAGTGAGEGQGLQSRLNLGWVKKNDFHNCCKDSQFSTTEHGKLNQLNTF